MKKQWQWIIAIISFLIVFTGVYIGGYYDGKQMEDYALTLIPGDIARADSGKTDNDLNVGVSTNEFSYIKLPTDINILSNDPSDPDTLIAYEHGDTLFIEFTVSLKH